MKSLKLLAVSLAAIILAGSAPALVYMPQNHPGKVEVKIISDEADAVMNILAKQSGRQAVTEGDWSKLFSSDGYIRLKKREEGMKRAFTDSDFKAFVLSEDLAKKKQALGEALGKWKIANVGNAARSAQAYLPEGSGIKAKIYIVIKPKTNSFVTSLDTDPSIFLYLDPEVTKKKFENTLAHELHHIGYSSNCQKAFEASLASLPTNVKTAIECIGAFGEGFAMLAAAGGPDIHPHAVSLPAERERWDRDMLNFNPDLKKVEAYLSDILAKKLTDAEIDTKGSEFFGIQGPWYTVGWKMSVVIEKTYGRQKLLECIVNPRILLSVYNSAVPAYNLKYHEKLATWSESLIRAIGG